MSTRPDSRYDRPQPSVLPRPDVEPREDVNGRDVQPAGLIGDNVIRATHGVFIASPHANAVDRSALYTCAPGAAIGVEGARVTVAPINIQWGDHGLPIISVAGREPSSTDTVNAAG
jgi:hypothetical protein